MNVITVVKDVLNLDILLKGSPILTVDENTEIFDAGLVVWCLTPLSTIFQLYHGCQSYLVEHSQK
jgi:hypothetical protein